MAKALEIREALEKALEGLDPKTLHPNDRIALVMDMADAMFPKNETADLIAEAMGPFRDEWYVQGSQGEL